MTRKKQIYNLQLLKWRIFGINQKPAAFNTNSRSRDEQTIGNTNIYNHRDGGWGRNSRGHHNNRGGRYQHNAGKGHGRYAGTTGQGCGWEQNSDYIPQEVLNSLTPQQCWYLLQGQDALSQADTTTSTAHQNERTVGAGTTNTETASMVSGISQNMLPSGVPSPTMTGTHWWNMSAIMANNRHIGQLNKLQESDDYQGWNWY